MGTWGAEKTLMEAATDRSLTPLGAPKEIDASCLGHLCKVTVSFETEGQAGDWAELYVLGMADAVSFVQTMRTTTADGRPQLVLYGARKGSERRWHRLRRDSRIAKGGNSAVRD